MDIRWGVVIVLVLFVAVAFIGRAFRTRHENPVLFRIAVVLLVLVAAFVLRHLLAILGVSF